MDFRSSGSVERDIYHPADKSANVNVLIQTDNDEAPEFRYSGHCCAMVIVGEDDATANVVGTINTEETAALLRGLDSLIQCLIKRNPLAGGGIPDNETGRTGKGIIVRVPGGYALRRR
ncbi:MAG: hypothetical protein J5744_09260 [Oscillospiraceae bacterium]|nr:hypothetical protein [Oscillospiraceae bacterium]